MQLKPVQSNSPLGVQVVSFDNMNSDEIRNHLRQVTRDFKDSWRNLAQGLQVVYRDKLYREWGYTTFDQYTAKEVHVRKHTAMKLIRSYAFLEKEEPLHLPQGAQEGRPHETTLSFEAAHVLQRAKKVLDDDEYQKVKKGIVQEGRNIQDVKKALILKQRKDIDSEQARTHRGKVSINRFLAVLRDFSRDIKMLQILPGSIADEIDTLIKKIEKVSVPLIILFALCPMLCFAYTLDDAHKEYLYGNYEAAIEKAAKLKESDTVLYFLGLGYMKMENYSKARSYLRKLLKKFHDSKIYERALVKLADTYFLEKNFPKAEAFYKEIKEKYPCSNFSSLIYLKLAQIASREGKWEEKKKYLKIIKEKYPQSIEMKFVNILENYGDFFTIQVGAFSSRENALAVKKELSEKYSVYVIEDKKEGLTLYKVRVGKFRQKKKAEKISLKLCNEGYPARIY
ncbi:MAG: SPOR domain-containing protein, partial [Candidatus Omnitrophica bacterium]|nr:SPOR domain-containing protein [Candidatus Omnitrophota bacterium]